MQGRIIILFKKTTTPLKFTILSGLSGGGGGGVWLFITLSTIFNFYPLDNTNSPIFYLNATLILAAGSETAIYKTIFQLATAYELIILGFFKIIMKYQLKFQMIMNNMYFLFLHQYL